MPRKRKHLSRAHRQKISLGVKRAWQRKRRALAQRRTKDRARRRLKKIQRELAPREKLRTEDWELTIRYSKKGKALGMTMRITAPMGTPREVVAIVARRAGMANGTVERGFQVRDIEWQKPLKDYPYGDDIQTGLQVSGWTGLLASGTIRLERVKE
jgi:hypothetical protein